MASPSEIALCENDPGPDSRDDQRCPVPYRRNVRSAPNLHRLRIPQTNLLLEEAGVRQQRRGGRAKSKRRILHNRLARAHRIVEILVVRVLLRVTLRRRVALLASVRQVRRRYLRLRILLPKLGHGPSRGFAVERSKRIAGSRLARFSRNRES